MTIGETHAALLTALAAPSTGQPGIGELPPGPGQAAATDGGGATGGAANGAAAPMGGGGSNIFLLLMLGLVAVMVFSLLGQRREKKRRESLLGSIRKHDRVQTIGGVIGSVVDVKDDSVVLKVDESSNTRITFARAAIQQVLKSGSEDSA